MKTLNKLGILFVVSMFLFISLGVAIQVSGKDSEKIPIFNSKTGKVESLEKVAKTNEEWQKLLTAEQFHITRQKGTERAFSGKYHDYKKNGIYKCIACGTDLYSSETKFDSRTGWPSFWAPISELNIKTQIDNSLFMQRRTELLCARCDAHLGHVFNDGPPPTHQRHCINSAALNFVKKER